MWCASIGSSAWLTAGCHKEGLTIKYRMSRFAHAAEEDRPYLISNESCVSIAVRLKLLNTSVSTFPFQIWHAIYQKDEQHPPAKERPQFGLK